MIIWGSKSRETTEHEGEFHCPHCAGETRTYKLIKVSKYFTLYFIPLFPMETLGKYIKCKTCNSDYNESVLEYVPPTEQEKLQYAVYQDLQAGMPVQMVVRKLQNQNWSEADAQQIVDSVTARQCKRCPACNLDFHDDLTSCSNCGGTLPTRQAALEAEVV